MLLIKRKKIKKMLKNKLESLNLHREKMIWPRRTLNLLVQNKYEEYYARNNKIFYFWFFKPLKFPPDVPLSPWCRDFWIKRRVYFYSERKEENEMVYVLYNFMWKEI